MKRAPVQIIAGFEGHEETVANLFVEAFTASEGPDEGAMVGDLVRDLFARTPADDIRAFRAVDRGHRVGAVVFTRLTYPDDRHCVVLLSPMAVATDRQRQGIGQKLIGDALHVLQSEGADVAITYGDPDYYRRVGFKPLTEDQARAPLPLSHPHGWIGRALSADGMPVLQGRSICVPALNRPDLW